MQKLIVTGDDFGLAVPVNEAIEEAHRSGILTSASLMVGAAAAKDAVARAKRLGSLNVGLHLVLTDGRALLPKRSIPDLVNEDGEFLPDPFRAGVKYFFQSNVSRQLEVEIRAQFQAFRETGLALDHVNGHNHLHLHPTVLGLILRVGREFGLRAMRLPYEPLLPSWRASGQGFVRKLAGWLLIYPWVALLRARLKRAGIRCNDYVFGLSDSGHLHRKLLLSLLQELPQGVTEIYCHPSTRRCEELDRAMPGYLYEQEFEAFTSQVVKEAVATSGLKRVSFSEL
ncbi:MAG TPA: hopanoid biosynthesis-associated protein HpnK [Nitrospira sp.]|nr:hopanoid biosynthesis-associated protein HpnK [Nitrospira sp.]